MNPIYVCGLILCAVAAVSCKERCTPDQWEGTEVSHGAYMSYKTYNHPHYISERNVIHYDAKNMRKAVTIHYNNNEEWKKNFQMVTLYSNATNGKVYVVDEGQQKCWTNDLSRPFRKACVPADKKVSSYSLGLKGKGGLPVDNYFIKKEGMGVDIGVATVGDSIIPVTERVRGHFKTIGQFEGAKFAQNIQFSNITPGIKDESVFDIPTLCKKQIEEAEMPEYMLREHYILAI